ncbi:hypothetical protein [Phenylobacterium sp.]|uniref:hypothetical protein n=1 Tax=Phenylobacterium sp. TaxID=1871053 RepID=UPI001224FA79|nr:hypothetical protein [Phenylobacterium sp.]THD51661.1 MAG: hypothetical protein E8A12_20715 [Phenylobacterium sp.]
MRGGWLVLVVLACAATVAASAAAKQTSPTSSKPPPPASTVSGITVEGPATQSPLIDRTTEFVRQRLPTSRFAQYARFHDPICVKVVGLPDQYAGFIVKRVLDVAREVNAPIDPKPGCTPNVNVIFSAAPQAQLEDIARRRDILFGFHFQAEMKKLSTFSRPVQAWYVTRTEDTTGNKMLELNEATPCISSNPLRPPCDVSAPAIIGKAGSRLGNDLSSELVHSLIIADANKVAGEKIDAIADYIAVLALSRWQGMERCSGLPTILNLMADGCSAEDRPEAATPGDLALLTSLYQVNPREVGTLQRAEIADAMRKAAGAASDSRH